MRKLTQILIAIDQLLNTLIGGYADETLSAHAYRQRGTKKHWTITYKVINAIFFWQINHCENSYMSEFERRQLPTEYR